MILSTKWSDGEDARLKELILSGHTMDETSKTINREFGTKRTRNAVIGRSHRLGIQSKIDKSRDYWLTSNRMLNKPEKPAPKPRLRKKRKPLVEVIVMQSLPPPKPLPEPIILGEGLTTLLDRKHDQCCAVVKETTLSRPALYCGNRKFGKSPYCQNHADQFYSGGKAMANRIAANIVKSGMRYGTRARL